jgi:hypothetical protein
MRAGLIAASMRMNILLIAAGAERARIPMAKYVPSPADWVREQVELYGSSGGTEGTTLLIHGCQ